MNTARKTRKMIKLISILIILLWLTLVSTLLMAFPVNIWNPDTAIDIYTNDVQTNEVLTLTDYIGIPEDAYTAAYTALIRAVNSSILDIDQYGIVSWDADAGQRWAIATVIRRGQGFDGSFLLAARYWNSRWEASLDVETAAFSTILESAPDSLIAPEQIPYLTGVGLPLAEIRGIPVALRFPWQDGQTWTYNSKGIHGDTASDTGYALDFVPSSSIAVGDRRVVAGEAGFIFRKCSQTSTRQEYLVVRHGGSSSGYATYYFHLDRSTTTGWSVGNSVGKGNILGTILNHSGTLDEGVCGFSFGPHVHYGVGQYSGSSLVKVSIVGQAIEGWTVQSNGCLRRGTEEKCAGQSFTAGSGGDSNCTVSLSSPGDGATLTNTTPTFSWQSPSSCSHSGYTLHVTTTNNPEGGIIKDTGVGNTSYNEYSVPSDYHNRDLWWHIRVANGPSNAGWSTRRFRIQPENCTVSLSSPSDGATLTNTTPTFSWQAPSNCSHSGYTLHVTTTSNPESGIIKDTGVGNTFYNEYSVPSDYYNRDLWWHIRVANSSSSAGWSTRRFRIQPENCTVSLSSPSDGATLTNATPTFSWQAPSNCSHSGYTIHITTTNNPESGIIKDTGVGGTSYNGYAVPAQYHNSDLWWHIRVANSSSNAGWSTRRFRIQPENCTVSLTSPSDGAALTNTTPTFSWQAPSSCSHSGYTLHITTTNNPESGIIKDTGVGGTSYNGYAVPAQYHNTDLWWHIRVANSSSSAGWSTRRFRIQPENCTVSLSSPSDGATLTNTTPTFSWQAPSNCSHSGYTLHITTTNNPESGIIKDTGVGGTSYNGYAVPAQYHNSDLWWHIRVANSSSNAGWSTRRFRIQPLIAPQNDNIDNALAVAIGENTVTISSVEAATISNNEPSNFCPDIQGGHSVWFRLLLNTSADVTLDTVGSNYDTVLAVFTGTPASLQGYVCNDDHSGSNASRIQQIFAANTYYIRVSTYNAQGSLTVPTSLVFHSIVVPAAPPANNDFAGAIVVSESEYTYRIQGIEHATIEALEPQHACTGRVGGHSVWFQLNLSTNTRVELDTQGSIYPGTAWNQDTTMSIYQGTTLAALQSVACNDDFAPSEDDTSSDINQDLSLGTYYVRITSYGDQGTLVAPSTLYLNLFLIAAPPLPPVISLSNATANEGTSSSVTFTMTLDAAVSQIVTVDYATIPGTAFDGYDFVPTSGTVIFPPNSISQSIAVSLVNDGRPEVSESFAIALSSPVNATLGTVQAAAIINDDDLTTGYKIKVKNRSFETPGSAANLPKNWVMAVGSGSGRKCANAFGYTSLCAFNFKGANAVQYVSQILAPSFMLVPGDVISAKVWARGKQKIGTMSASLWIEIDGIRQAMPINGKFPYTQLSLSVPVMSGPTSSIKIGIDMLSNGKVALRLDKVAVTVTTLDERTTRLNSQSFPSPVILPEGWRGN